MGSATAKVMAAQPVPVAYKVLAAHTVALAHIRATALLPPALMTAIRQDLHAFAMAEEQLHRKPVNDHVSLIRIIGP